MNVTGTVTNTNQVTLRDALRAGLQRLAASPSARRDAELLLLRAADSDRATLLTHPERLLSPEALTRYDSFIERRAAAEPIQYILGEQEFFGLRFEVTPAVLIPRPETEHLVEALLARVPRDQPVRIADVGTGSGAIAVAIAHSVPHARITALDNSPAALGVALRNAQYHQAEDRIDFLESDLLGVLLPDASQGEVEHTSPTRDTALFDAILSNPPYISSAEQLEPQVQNYEPHQALFAGPTGLEVYQRLIPQAARLLRPAGWLLLEIGAGQQPAIEKLLANWAEVSFSNDLQHIPRVAAARRA